MRPAIVCIVFGLSWAGQTACSSSDAPGAGDVSSSVADTTDGVSTTSSDTLAGQDTAQGADTVSLPDAGPAVDVEPVIDTLGPQDVANVDAGEVAEVSLGEDILEPGDDGLVIDVTTVQDVMLGGDAVESTGSDVGSESVDVTGVGPEVVEMEDVGGLPVPEDLWLFSVHTPTKTLLKVDVETGVAEAWCTLPDGVTNYPSLTFDRNNGLLASRAAKPWGLDQIDPCTCEVTPVGEYGTFTEVNGITADAGFNLFGIASGGNELISISSQTAAATGVGTLEVDFTTGGATWSDETDALFAINGGDDSLYTIDPDTAATAAVISLDYDFGTVGMERHPLNGVLYACSTSGELLSVDPASGEVTVIGPMGWDGACTNLAAPYEWVGCVDGE